MISKREQELIGTISKVMHAMQDIVRDSDKLKAIGKSDQWIEGSRDMFEAISAFLYPVVMKAMTEMMKETVSEIRIAKMDQAEKELSTGKMDDAAAVLKQFMSK